MKLSKTRLTKSALSILLSLCMIMTCFNVALISTDAAIIGSESIGGGIDNVDHVKFHANFTGYDDGGNSLSTWSDWSMSQADSNHYYYTFYTAASQTEKDFGWHAGGSDGEEWYTMNGEKFSSSQVDKEKEFTKNCSTNDKLTTISSASGWVKVQIDWYGNYGSSSYVKFYQTAVTAITSSVNVGSSTVTGNHTTTITPSSSGGTGSTTNSVKVYQGSVSGTDVTSTVLSGTTFTAPDVDSTTTYYVVNTATDSKIHSYSKASSAVTITVTPDTTPKILTFTVGGGASTTLKIGEKAALASTTRNAGANSVTYTSSAPTKVAITNDNKVQALEPCTNVTITASLTGAVSKTVTVSVTTPTLSFSYSPDWVYVNGYSTGTPSTPTASNVHAGTTVSAVSYRISSGGTHGTIASNGVVTSTASAGTVTVEASGTVTYDGVSYSGALGTATVTVKEREPVYLLGLKNDYNWTVQDSNKMTYNDTTHKYEITRYLYKQATTYGGTDEGNPSDTGFKIYANSTWYGADSDGFTIDSSDNNLTLTSTNDGKNICLTTKNLSSAAAGDIVGGKVPYKFTYDYTSHELYVYYPMKVTFNTNGHGTAPDAQVVAYNNKATAPSAPTETGYTFGGWYTDSGCTAGNEFDFANTAIAADTTLYAKWTKNSYTITYPAEGSRIGYTLSSMTPSPVDYNDPVSFTVVVAAGYRIKSVKYITSDSVEHTLTPSVTTYSFNMPDSNVTVSIEAIRIFTVTLVTQTENLSGTIVDDVGFASRTYKIDSGSSSSYTVALTSVDEGSVVTFGVTYNTGYEYYSVTNATASDSDTTFTTAAIFADTTVTITAKETSRTVNVVRRFTNADNTTTVGALVEFFSVGISTSATVSPVLGTDLKLSANPLQNPDAEDYEFNEFTLPEHIVGTPNGSSSFEISMSSSANQSTYTIYIDYDEILHTLTLRVTPEGSGNIKKNNANVTTLEVGNVTAVSLTAVPITGYRLIRWEQEGSFSTSAPSGTTPNTTYSSVRISGDSTLTAVFEEIAYTVTLIRKIYKIDGVTPLDELEEIYYQVGRYTPVSVSAPRVANSQFMSFTIPAAVSLATGYTNTDSTIEITATADAIIYANYKSSGNISVYIDMNENIGTPILNFKYFVDNTGKPVEYSSYDTEDNEPVTPEGATVANLPCEMELVTGSESVYKYTVKLTKLRDDYKMGQHKNGETTVSDLIKISYITVENNKIGEGTGYLIDEVAYTTGEVWLKADSTNMKGFNIISYGSVRNTFIGLIGDGQPSTSHELLVSAINTVHGTGIHTDDEDVYHAQYAGLYTRNGNLLNNFSYTLNVNLNQQVTRDGTTYYFDRWVKCRSTNFVKNANGTYSFSDSVPLTLPTSDLNILKAPSATGDSGGDYSYIALYKPVTDDENSNVRLKITYHFNDYDTSDGNYIFDSNTDPVTGNYSKVTPATYIKYVTTAMTSYPLLETYTGYADAASANVPYIKSNYFDYSFDRAVLTTVLSTELAALTEQKLILVDAYLTETARSYTILFNNGSLTTKTGFYQNPEVLEAPSGMSNPVWKMKVVDSGGTSSYVTVGTGSTYTARYMALGSSADGTLNDCQVIKVENGSGTAVNYRSDIYNSYTEHYYSGDSQMLRHNFYIIDYCGEGELVGGGVLFATGTESDGNFSYRYQLATDNLSTKADRESFIEDIIGIRTGSSLTGVTDNEYQAQSINNIGFRYKPFKETEDVFRYSDDMNAYLTVFEASNVNSTDYNGQKLRMFSFMVYNDGTSQSPSYHIVCSDGYAEVSRYIP